MTNLLSEGVGVAEPGDWMTGTDAVQTLRETTHLSGTGIT
jgi:hypothetical protein